MQYFENMHFFFSQLFLLRKLFMIMVHISFMCRIWPVTLKILWRAMLALLTNYMKWKVTVFYHQTLQFVLIGCLAYVITWVLHF